MAEGRAGALGRWLAVCSHHGFQDLNYCLRVLRENLLLRCHLGYPQRAKVNRARSIEATVFKRRTEFRRQPEWHWQGQVWRR